MTPLERIESVIAHVIQFRGFTSPETFARSFAPQRPMSGMSIRRIMDGSDTSFGTPDFDLKLSRLDGMLGIPLGTLSLAFAGDTAAIESLPFKPEDESVRQFIIRVSAHEPLNPRRRSRHAG